MVRRPAAQGKADANQTEIIEAFEKCGCKVIDLSKVGGGCPDLLIGHRYGNDLIEVKTEKGKQTQAQLDFEWPNRIEIVRSIKDVHEVIAFWKIGF